MRCSFTLKLDHDTTRPADPLARSVAFESDTSMAPFGCHCALALSPRTTLQMITELIPRARARLIPIAAIISVALQLRATMAGAAPGPTSASCGSCAAA